MKSPSAAALACAPPPSVQAVARSVAGAALLLAALTGCDRVAGAPAAVPPRAPSAAPPAKSLLLFTWDTTRADRIGAYGWSRATTPGFDTLAARGLLYERAYAAAPVTLPSHTTILTGVYPCAHGVRDNAIFQVGGEARLLSEALKEAGFATGAFVASFILDAKFGLAQGFDVYEAPLPGELGLGWNVIERSAPQVTEGALRFIDGLAPGQRFFLWVHYYDPHAPHESAPGERQGEQDDYDAEIARCDREARRLLERLAAKGLDDGLLTVITADHGEGHGEHGELSHGNFVYDATMRVPLVVAPPPAGVAPGTRIAAPVSTSDIAATVLERLGVGRAALPDSRAPTLLTVAPLDEGPDAEQGERAIYLEAFTPYYAHRWHPLQAVVWKGHKYIRAPRPELYAVGSLESDDLLPGAPQIAAALAARLDALLAEHAPLGWEAQGAISSDDVAKLAQLGYAGVASVGDLSDPDLPDPKERIGDLLRFDRIERHLFEVKRLLKLDVALRTGRRPQPSAEEQARGEAELAGARAELAAIRAGNPNDPFLDQIESTLEIHLQRFAEAIPLLERALLRTPWNMPLRYNLAVAYVSTERAALGVREMEKALFVEPRSLQAHRWLAQVCVSLKDWPAAAWWLDEMAKLPGQSAGDHEGIARARARVAQELAKSGGAPRPPQAVDEAQLLPERLREAAPATGDER